MGAADVEIFQLRQTGQRADVVNLRIIQMQYPQVRKMFDSADAVDIFIAQIERIDRLDIARSQVPSSLPINLRT